MSSRAVRPTSTAGAKKREEAGVGARELRVTVALRCAYAIRHASVTMCPAHQQVLRHLPSRSCLDSALASCQTPRLSLLLHASSGMSLGSAQSDTGSSDESASSASELDDTHDQSTNGASPTAQSMRHKRVSSTCTTTACFVSLSICRDWTGTLTCSTIRTISSPLILLVSESLIHLQITY